jgi:hypothetical protein
MKINKKKGMRLFLGVVWCIVVGTGLSLYVEGNFDSFWVNILLTAPCLTLAAIIVIALAFTALGFWLWLLCGLVAWLTDTKNVMGDDLF